MPCPTCGAEIDRDRLLIALDENTMVYKDQTIKLRCREAELLYALTEFGIGALIDRDQLIARVYGVREPKDPNAAIRALILQLRRKMTATGIKIETEGHAGWRVVET